MDKEQARLAFETYVAAYDANNPRILLKSDHTLRVAKLCTRIAKGIGLGPQDCDLAWLVGLLHDIGRFEQVRRYDTFNDSISVSHAQLGADLLFEDDRSLLRRFVLTSAHDQLIHAAVSLHSAYRLPDELDMKTRTFCNILRDADKIDIIRVNRTCPIEDIYGVSAEQMRSSELSPTCIEHFYEHRCLPRGIRTYPADILLGHICFAWELVYPVSLKLLREQGYLAEMLTQRWELPQTQKDFDAMGRHMREALGI